MLLALFCEAIAASLYGQNGRLLASVRVQDGNRLVLVAIVAHDRFSQDVKWSP